jgi:hypothetical protein
MTIGAGVFALTEANKLVPLQTASFASENDFQTLLAAFPALLAGDQIDPVNPRRFLLIDREHPIAGEPGGGTRWALDHLFIDRDGVPTLVEVKRSDDTRIRREVVGQMLDYAANAILHWPTEELQERFAARCAKASVNADNALHEHLGTDLDAETFWAKVRANLQAGRIRLLFVADRIPGELRKVIEFLNRQMQPAQVLAVELRQYEGGNIRTFAPIVLGRSQEAIDLTSDPSSSNPRRVWDEAQILEALAARSELSLSATAKAIINWIKQTANRLDINDAPVLGSFGPEFSIDTQRFQVFRFWTDGSAAINFGQLKLSPAFASASARQTMVNRLNTIAKLGLQSDKIDGYSYFRLTALTADHGAGFLEVMSWVADELHQKPAVAA